MTIADLYPDTKPSLLLDFANVKALDPRITFTRASSATYYDAQGTLQTAASGVPRFDHDPVTGKSLGLLIEEQRTNLLLRSEEFNDVAWSKFNSSIAANTIVAPSGALSGSKLIEDTSTNIHGVYQNYLGTSVTLAVSVYAKADQRPRLNLQISNFVNDAAAATFNLVDGTFSGVTSSNIDYTNVSASLQHVGNGWYRCSVTAVKGTASNNNYAFIGLDTGSLNNYTGDGTSGIYIWGAQLEAGAFPTSYIKTEASQVTRSTDAASMTGTNFSSWYRQDEGTIFAITQLTGYSSTSNPSLVTIANSASISNNNINMFVAGGSGNYRSSIVESGVGTFLQNVTTITNIYDVVPWAIAYKTNDAYSASRYFIGNPTDTAVTIPTTVNTLYMNASSSVRKYIRKIAFYPQRLTNAQLQALTR